MTVSSDSELLSENTRANFRKLSISPIGLDTSTSSPASDSGVAISSSSSSSPVIKRRSNHHLRRVRSFSFSDLPQREPESVTPFLGLSSDGAALDVELHSSSTATTVPLDETVFLQDRPSATIDPTALATVAEEPLLNDTENPFETHHRPPPAESKPRSSDQSTDCLQDYQLEDSDDAEVSNLLTELSGLDTSRFSKGAEGILQDIPDGSDDFQELDEPTAVDTTVISITSTTETESAAQSVFLQPASPAEQAESVVIVDSESPKGRKSRPQFSKELMSAAFITSSDDFHDGPPPKKRPSKRSRLVVSSDEEEHELSDSHSDVDANMDSAIDPTQGSGEPTGDADEDVGAPPPKKVKSASKRKASNTATKKADDNEKPPAPKKKVFRSSFGGRTKKALPKKKVTKAPPKPEAPKADTNKEHESGDIDKPVDHDAIGKEMDAEEMDVDVQNGHKEAGSTEATAKSSSPAKPKRPQMANMAQFFNKKATASAESSKVAGIPFSDLCEALSDIEETTKRLEITAICTDLFKRIIDEAPDNLVPAIYLCVNRLGPEYEAPELGVGEGMLIKAIAEATGRTLDKVKADLKTHGDLGLVAQRSKGTQKSLGTLKKLSVTTLFAALKQIAEFSGSSSATKKLGKIKFLIASCKGVEVKYLIRILQGKLRIGLAEQTVIVSLAQAAAYAHADSDGSITKPDLGEAAKILKGCFSEVPSYEYIVPLLLEFGIFDMRDKCRIQPGVPVKPMLAHPSKSITEVLNRFEGLTFASEFKYDGERAQIHLTQEGQIKIFSRNMEDLSTKYPDIVKRVPSFIKEGTTSFVLDCECVAYDTEAKSILPFQVLSTRKRKDVQQADIKVQVVLFGFDCLYLNGDSLLNVPFEDRLDKMSEHFAEESGSFEFAKRKICKSSEDIQTFLEDAIQSKCEGLMVKTMGPDSTYEPSQRSRSWLKLKKDYLDNSSSLADSIDVTVIGGYHGKGKRTGWYGGFLLAIYDKGAQEYQAVAKIGTGFSEEFLKEAKEFFDEQICSVKKDYYRVTDTIKPDVWFEPAQVSCSRP